MQYLLDTHVILWWFTDPKKISPKANKIIKDKSNTIFLSSASFWEMAIKKSLERLTLPHNLLETVTAESFKILPILPEESLGVADLPLLHSDPFDRILIIQAKLNDLILITHDKKIAEYPVVTIAA
ncbi:MAG TPA: type II toxin-antitoxin system VapC family toxin [Gammaproteobacteria bacterium]|jgi:PIN domain nuclease of toxin-antitoxin system|nr:type II toxin-antitoxin system VapC family toxin [Gammaproteobacteria bacterium]